MASGWTPREPPAINVNATFVLDRWRREDAAALRQFDLDPKTARFFGWTVAQARALPDEHYDGEQRAQGSLAAWRLGEQLSLAIRRRADGEAVGWVELRPDGNEAAVSYMVRQDLRGQGIVPRALDAMLGWAAAEIGIRQVRLGCHVKNVASRRVAEKCGFLFLGRDGNEFRFHRYLRA